jgi:hypothetical protein
MIDSNIRPIIREINSTFKFNGPGLHISLLPTLMQLWSSEDNEMIVGLVLTRFGLTVSAYTAKSCTS